MRRLVLNRTGGWLVQQSQAVGRAEQMAVLIQRTWLAAACCSLGAAGCGCTSDIVAVSGRVTLDGQPLAGAVVTFQPILDRGATTATGSVGRTDSEGRFVLRLISPDRPGAAVGEHTVTITTATASGSDAQPPQGERLPKAWQNGSHRFRVPPGGTREANFDVRR
jgi:hypothetical protein